MLVRDNHCPILSTDESTDCHAQMLLHFAQPSRCNLPALCTCLLTASWVRYCRFVIASLRDCVGFYCGTDRLCQRCCGRCSDHAAVLTQKQEPLTSITGRLKKQGSNLISHSTGRSALTGDLDIIAPDTRYAGQQVLTTGRQTTAQSPDSALLMELSRRGSAPRQV